MKIVDIEELAELLSPSKETHLAKSMDKIDLFLAEHIPKSDFESSVLLDMMEQLTDDLSRVYDLHYTSWYVEKEIDKAWSITCQCQRIVNFCRYNVVMWKDYTKKEGGKDIAMTVPYQLHSWSEKLPEKN